MKVNKKRDSKKFDVEQKRDSLFSEKSLFKNEEKDIYTKIKEFKREIQESIKMGKEGIITGNIASILDNIETTLNKKNNRMTNGILDEQILLKPIKKKKETTQNLVTINKNDNLKHSNHTKEENQKKDENTEEDIITPKSLKEMKAMEPINNENQILSIHPENEIKDSKIKNTSKKLKKLDIPLNFELKKPKMLSNLTAKKHNSNYLISDTKKQLKRDIRISNCKNEIKEKIYKELKSSPSLTNYSIVLAKKVSNGVPLYKRTQEVVERKELKLKTLKCFYDDLYQIKLNESSSRKELIRCSSLSKIDHGNFEEWRKKNVDFYFNKYEKYKKLKIVKDQEQEEIDSSHNFTPTINKNSTIIATSYRDNINPNSFYDRINSQVRKKKDKIKEITQSITPSFNPNINKNSYKLGKNRMQKSKSSPQIIKTKRVSKNLSIKDNMKSKNKSTENLTKVEKKTNTNSWKSLVDSINENSNKAPRRIPKSQSLYQINIQDNSVCGEKESKIFYHAKHHDVLDDIKDKLGLKKMSIRRSSLRSTSPSRVILHSQSKILTDDIKAWMISEEKVESIKGEMIITNSNNT